MDLGVIGGGVVGLATAAGFGSLGHRVVCVEKDGGRRKQLKGGQFPRYEPGLAALAQQGLDRGQLRFSGDVGEAVAASQVLLICVGTPAGAGGEADLSQVRAAAAELGAALAGRSGYRLLVEKSSVPVGTHREIARIVGKQAGAAAEFGVASVPEFLQEGRAVEDFLHPARLIIGVDCPQGKALLEELYGSFDCRQIWTDPATAELTKYAANAFLAMKISYANLLADLSAASGADLEQVTAGLGGDPRIGPEFLRAGLGYGGDCLPKDVAAFAHLTAAVGVDADLLRAVDGINRRRPRQLVGMVEEVLGGLAGRSVAVWGLAFKPAVEDVRSAPSLAVVRLLLEAGARVTAHDPAAMGAFRESFGEQPGLDYGGDMYAAAAGKDAALVLTEWADYRAADLARLRDLMARPVLVDGRRIWNPVKAREWGFEYRGFGYPQGGV